ncbi:unnamed protein product [Haemonchus placei]|uniref:Uncharacterized protein n=1 Tax=Haemonchus placei TaxID=6290 RepID=A0A0N4WLD1_HAEPC|nr:unnamed protein product [Haemonchus placei]
MSSPTRPLVSRLRPLATPRRCQTTTSWRRQCNARDERSDVRLTVIEYRRCVHAMQSPRFGRRFAAVWPIYNELVLSTSR